MTREYQDASAVSFKAEIQWNEKPYTNPLFLITDEKDFISALSDRLPEGKWQARSIRLTNILSHPHGIRFEIEKAVSLQTLRNALRSDEVETELKHFRCISNVINDMRAIYYSCLDKTQPDSQDIETVFQILFYAAQYYDSVRLNIESMWSFALQKDMIAISQLAIYRQKAIRRYLDDYKQFELFYSIYHGFVDANTEIIKEYEYAFRKHHTEKYRQSYVYFWRNRAFFKELRELFWDYCRKLPDSNTKTILFKRDVISLKACVLDSLDILLQNELKSSSPCICTKDGTVKWCAKSLENAEYLCLFSDLIRNKKYRVCPICGSIFEVNQRYHTQIYCSMHTATQIQYYNRKRNKRIEE